MQLFIQQTLAFRLLYNSLLPGYFAIYYPQDGHMPCLVINEEQIVKKVVIKVEIEDQFYPKKVYKIEQNFYTSVVNSANNK